MEDIGKKLANGKALKGARRGALGVTGAAIEVPDMRAKAATVEEIERLVIIAIIAIIILKEVRKCQPSKGR